MFNTNYLGYENTRVRLPNGQVRRAEVTSATTNGYRTARISMSINGSPFKLRGRVTARHGFSDDRILPFEVVAEDAWLLSQDDETVYLKAA